MMTIRQFVAACLSRKRWKKGATESKDAAVENDPANGIGPEPVFKTWPSVDDPEAAIKAALAGWHTSL
tara:strand:- start:1397 stop:1600 length:204 start_codon:yes stop_codon:yes gene_type:complete